MTPNTSKPTNNKSTRGSQFFVGETPYCLWQWANDDSVVNFLNRLDPTYFDYVANAHLAALESEDAQHAAVALRASYQHALETFFALLFASIQAPTAIPAWLRMYRPGDLDKFVDSVSKHMCDLPNPFGLQRFGWEQVTDLIVSIQDKDTQNTTETKAAFRRMWAHFAGDFLDQHQRAEYNSIKHGMRVKPGGFALSVGEESFPGQPVPPQQMKLVGSSKYGSAYFVTEKFEDLNDDQKRVNFRLKEVHLNWHPMNCAWGIVMIGQSIQNTASFAKIRNGIAPEKVEFIRPTDLADCQKPWAESVGVTSSCFEVPIPLEYIRPVTADQVRSVLKPKEK